MRRVVLFHMWSLDGVAEEPGDWVLDVDQAVFANIAEVIGSQDAVLLGRGTYDYWSGHWPNGGEEPFRAYLRRARISDVRRSAGTAPPGAGRLAGHR
ncbi:MAG: hypothetical protein ACXWZ2_11670 [Mycobacterium sp.]